MTSRRATDPGTRPAPPKEPLSGKLQRLIDAQAQRTPVEVTARVPMPSRSRRGAVEAPTLLVALAVYGGWLGMTSVYGHWPLAMVAPIVAVLLTWHGSLQHEIVHGHPTRWKSLNRTLGVIPLSLWLPYARYRQTHLLHHIDARLTDPLDDPESFYWRPEDWARLSPIARASLRIQQTLSGRVLLGPYWIVARFLRAELRAVLRDERDARAIWLEHVVWCVPVIVWVNLVCGIPLWLYGVAMVMPGTGVTLIRSFAEHRARPAVRERSAIVEGSWILGPLFLFNNLHALHHETPGLPWYEYNGRYRRERDRLIAENGALVYRTYFDVARRFLFRAHDTPQHPLGRAP